MNLKKAASTGGRRNARVWCRDIDDYKKRCRRVSRDYRLYKNNVPFRSYYFPAYVKVGKNWQVVAPSARRGKSSHRMMRVRTFVVHEHIKLTL